MQVGVYFQLLVRAMGMDRKMKVSVGLGRRWRDRWIGREYLKRTLSKSLGEARCGSLRPPS